MGSADGNFGIRERRVRNLPALPGLRGSVSMAILTAGVLELFRCRGNLNAGSELGCRSRLLRHSQKEAIRIQPQDRRGVYAAEVTGDVTKI